MTDPRAVIRLTAWLSAVFPTGSFSYSSGLETATQSGLVSCEEHLHDWLETSLAQGGLRNDAIFLTLAWRACCCPLKLAEIASLALAMCGSRERYLEAKSQGQAFLAAARTWPQVGELEIAEPCPHSVAVGAVTGGVGIELNLTQLIYLQSAITNQLQVAIRLSLIGQSGAARLMVQLEKTVSTAAESAIEAGLDELGSSTVMAEIMAMKHEQLEARMFRS